MFLHCFILQNTAVNLRRKMFPLLYVPPEMENPWSKEHVEYWCGSTGTCHCSVSTGWFATHWSFMRTTEKKVQVNQQLYQTMTAVIRRDIRNTLPCVKVWVQSPDGRWSRTRCAVWIRLWKRMNLSSSMALERAADWVLSIIHSNGARLPPSNEPR